MPELDRRSRRACARSVRWWWRSPAAPTRPSWPGWPTARSAPTAAWPPPPCRRRWPATSGPTAPPSPPSGACAGARCSTTELDDLAYVANDGDRCSRCKTALMDVLGPMADATGATVVLGVNLDDLGDHRPGQQAAADRGAVFPLVDAGFTKAGRAVVVATARAADVGQAGGGLPGVAGAVRDAGDGGRAVTCGAGRGGAAPARLPRAAGSPLRRHGPHRGARSTTSARSWRSGEAVVAAVHAAGYRYVTLDLEGLRSGNLNDALSSSPASADASGGS